jgi:hypothetical protein
MKFDSNSRTMLFLQRKEQAAKVRARKKGLYNSVVWSKK